MADHFRACRLRCYPTRAQRSKLAQLFGAARWVWNRALSASSNAYSDPELTAMFGRGLAITALNFSRLIPQLKQQEEFAWLSACDSGVLAQALRNLRQAYANFFAGRGRYPRHKTKNHAQSIRFHFHHHHPGKMRAWHEGRLILPQLGEVDIVWSRRPNGPPKMVTVSQDCAGRFWVSMVTREQVHPLPANANKLGVDVGVKDLAVLSDGLRIPNPKKLMAKLRHLRRLSRGLSRKKKNSARWRLQRQRIAVLQSRIADARRDALHQASTSIIRKAGLIAIEQLNIAGMMKNRSLARSMADASISELQRQLIYKAKWYGREVVRTGRFEPTSQLCSTPKCGYRNRQLILRARRWHCPACGAEHDRDINAARNILTGGLRSLAGSGVGQGVPELMRVEGNDPRGIREQRMPTSALGSANPSSLLASSRKT